MNETDLVQEIIAWVKKNGGDAWHVHGSAVQRKGEPDIDGAILVPARGERWAVHFKVEAKVGNNQPSEIQARRLVNWKRLGYATGVVRSLEDFKAIIDRHAEDMAERCGGN